MKYFLGIILITAGCTASNSDSSQVISKQLTAPEETVIQFYDWYLQQKAQGEVGIELQSNLPDSIIQIIPGKYFSKLASSGYIAKEYIDQQQDRINACNDQLKKEKQTDGIPTCLETDLITGEQEQPKGFITRSVTINGGNAVVEASGYDMASTGDTIYCCSSKVTLKKDGNSWMITGIK